MELDKLEQLLALLQAYGATSYSDNTVQLNLVHLNRSVVVDEGEFSVDFSAASFTEDIDPN